MSGAASAHEGMAPVSKEGEAATLTAGVAAADERGIAAYRRFCENAVFPPPQSPDWLAAWASHHNDVLVVTLHVDEAPALALPLVVERSGVFRMARFVGGTHANGNFPALSLAYGADSRQVTGALVAALRQQRPDIDILALERQRTTFRGHANPLAALPHATSPNVSLAVDLTGGLEQVLRGSSGKRRRKKHRSQVRKLEVAGGYRRYAARTVEEVDLLLDAFFRMKHHRFAKMGISDVFDDPAVQASFRILFMNALQLSPPPFVLHALEVGGVVRAVTGSSQTEDTLICEFSTFAEDELAHASPGDFLFYENIAAAAEDGFAVYDFSVGDEAYKRIWCDLETHHADVIAGLSSRGHVVAAVLRTWSRAKRFIKTSPVLMQIVRRLRRRGQS
ncbi:GNAT family N-acetyltransferase [Nitratireductor luteus]|uniref:GNAT family N-acetyltransferase n=1 Tax=Nitratireductor luteus TaxID=2976980 RepID=UPI00223EE31F|nr:GNAT family N-acetyltransferase [Nitratireductor luteus]